MASLVVIIIDQTLLRPLDRKLSEVRLKARESPSSTESQSNSADSPSVGFWYSSDSFCPRRRRERATLMRWMPSPPTIVGVTTSPACWGMRTAEAL